MSPCPACYRHPARVGDELAHRYRHAHDPVSARTADHLLVAQPPCRSPRFATPPTVRAIVRRYNANRPSDRRHQNRGQPPLLSPVLLAELAESVADGPAPDGGVWSCHQAAAWIAKRLGRPVADVRGWEALRTLGFTLQRPRPTATQADPDAQDAFKKGGSRRRWMRSGPPIPPPS